MAVKEKTETRNRTELTKRECTARKQKVKKAVKRDEAGNRGLWKLRMTWID